MCFLDWRIGRLIRSVQHVSVADANGRIGIPASPQRVGLTVLGDNAGDGVLILPSGDTTAPSGAISGSNALQNHMTLATHGDLPTKAFTLLTLAGAGVAVSWCEYFAPEDVLQLGLEQIRNQYPL